MKPLRAETYARLNREVREDLIRHRADIRATKAINDFTDKQDVRAQRREQRGME